MSVQRSSIKATIIFFCIALAVDLCRNYQYYAEFVCFVELHRNLAMKSRCWKFHFCVRPTPEIINFYYITGATTDSQWTYLVLICRQLRFYHIPLDKQHITFIAWVQGQGYSNWHVRPTPRGCPFNLLADTWTFGLILLKIFLLIAMLTEKQLAAVLWYAFVA